MIGLEKIGKHYGSVRALEDVSFEIPAKAITIVTGADGAGKSTLFKIIVGLTGRDSGRILLRGRPVNHPEKTIPRFAGYMPERFSLYPDLTVEENMNFFAAIHGVDRKRRETLKHALLERTGMLAFRKRKTRALSGGMKQKLSLSTILLSSPDLIILDEPTTGVDPMSRFEFFTIIQDLKAEGKTILMATPYLDEAERGDNIVFIREGRVIRKNTIQRLRTEFPARLFRMRPKGNVFEALERMKSYPGPGHHVFLRGRTIRVLVPEGASLPGDLPVEDVEEQIPTLEDIYIYYERLENDHACR